METYTLYIERDKQGRYFAGDHDDAKLWVIAELLLDNQARAEAQQLIDNTNQKSVIGHRFHFFKEAPNTIIAKLFKPEESLNEEDNPLIIEIDQMLLASLIEGWRDLMKLKPSQIILSRRHDQDLIRLMYKP